MKTKKSSYLECPFGETLWLSSDKGLLQVIRRNQGREAGSGLHRQDPALVCRHQHLKSHDIVKLLVHCTFKCIISV